MMRIVSLAPSSTEILFSLAAGPQIVGVTRFCDYPAETRNIVRVGGWIDVDYSRIENLNPDLIFTSTFLQGNIAKTLSGRGFNVVHTDPKSLDEVYESVITIGKACGRIEESKILVRKIMNSLDEVKKSAAGGRIKIYCEEWHRPPTVSGNWVPDIIGIAGGKSMITSGQISRETTLEEVEEFDPGLIVVSLCGFGEKADKKFVSQRAGWQRLNAVKNGNIAVINDSLLNRPGPRLADAARLLSTLIAGSK
ncbi:MAG: cobalamin-binding protein [Candidatus Aenigmarchaeota archaeon]|nr:cobalamin-binding protein [Candidatus Aenigmarchaeota archaeon]